MKKNSLRLKKKVEKTHTNFISNFNFEEKQDNNTFNRIMTDSLGSSDIASLEIREKEFGSGNLKNIVENESESSLKKIKSPLLRSPKLPNERKKSKKSSLGSESNRKDLVFGDIKIISFDELPKLKEIKEIKEEKSEIDIPIDNPQPQISNNNISTIDSKKLIKPNISEENNKLNSLIEFEKMKAFVKYNPSFNFNEVIQKVNHKLRLNFKRKNGIRKKKSYRGKTHTPGALTGKTLIESMERSSSNKLSNSQLIPRKFSIFKSEIKPLKSPEIQTSKK